jgi:hypothetical protein
MLCVKRPNSIGAFTPRSYRRAPGGDPSTRSEEPHMIIKISARRSTRQLAPCTTGMSIVHPN